METHIEETHIEASRTETDNGGGNEDNNSSIFVRAIVIIGIIVILFFISMAIVKFVPKLFSSVGSLFGANGIEISTNAKEVKSSDSFVLNWENKSENKEGLYTVNFTCAENIKVEYETNNGLKPVICNTLFPLPKDAKSFPFTVTSENEKDKTLNFNVVMWDTTTNKEKLTGKGKINVLGLGTKTTVATSTAKDTSIKTVDLYTPSNNNNATGTTTKKDTKILPAPKTYTGNPDMAIRMVEIGWVDLYGSYHSGVSIPDGARVLVKFNVSNIGTAPTGSWTISAILPTKTAYERNFYSKTEPSVMPGASFVLNLAFDDFDSYSPTMTINLINSLDINTVNNTLVVTTPAR